VKLKIKLTPQHATEGTERESVWSSPHSQPPLICHWETPTNHVVQEAGWTPGPVSTVAKNIIFLILNFRPVVNVVFFLLGDSPASLT